MSASSERPTGPTSGFPEEAARDGAPLFGVVRQWLGTKGAGNGTDGLVFAYGLGITAVLVGVVNSINVITIIHSSPDERLFHPVISEGTSWLTLNLFLWIPWLAWRIAPPLEKPRWKLLLHIPAAIIFSLAHVASFVALRKLAFLLAGSHYNYGPFWAGFAYEFRKDVLGYALFVGMFALIDHFLTHRQPAVRMESPATFDIRDGAKILRVRFDDILAVASAGNYVEFILKDGRKPLMRAPLSTMETELAPRGFVRTHRSWLVNAGKVTALLPEGSGDYLIELGSVSAPLSRRFPDALARLRAHGA